MSRRSFTGRVIPSENQCPLCANHDTYNYYNDKKRNYFRCQNCHLIFVPKSDWLCPEEEHATYDLHENDSQDQGYRKFLSRLITPLLAKLDSKQNGLDFGCGPGPTLSVMLEEHGHKMDVFDPIYFNRPVVLTKHYDFICTTEVVEHFKNPFKEFEILFRILKPGGWLGIMTKLLLDDHDFGRWHYIRDLTHIVFYHHKSFKWVAKNFNAHLIFIGNDVIILKKN